MHVSSMNHAVSAAGGASPAPTGERRAGTVSLSDVVRVFKSRAARAVGRPIWQRSFYDHVVRDEADLQRIRQYIADNPLAWALDPENPGRTPA